MENKILYLLAVIAANLTLRSETDLLAEAEAFASENKPVKKKRSEPTAEEAAIIDALYDLYPTKTWRDNKEVSTGKNAKDKTRLLQLIRKRPVAEVEAIIKAYVEERQGSYLKNFSTFLNNFPDGEAFFKERPQLNQQIYQ